MEQNDITVRYLINSFRNEPSVEKLIKLIVYYTNATKILICWHITGTYWYVAGIYDNTLDNTGTNTEGDLCDNVYDPINLVGIYTNEEPVWLEPHKCIRTETAKLFYSNLHGGFTCDSVTLDVSNVGENKIKECTQDETFYFIVESYLTKLELLDKIHRQRNEQELMLSNISHSIRTPLNGILHCTSLINTQLDNAQIVYTNTQLDNAQIVSTNTHTQLESTHTQIVPTNTLQTTLKQLNQSTVALSTNIFDIIDLTKLTLGKLTFEKEIFQLHDLIESTMELANSLVKSPNTTLEFLIDNSVPYYIYSDYTRIKQILINILENAIQHTERGTVFLHVDATIVDLNSENGDTSMSPHNTKQLTDECQTLTYAIRFSIKDTGTGIDDQTKETLFKPNELLINAKQAGTSLRVSHMLATALGGTLTMPYSKIGVGSCFELTIMANEEQIPTSLVTLKRLNGKKILLVTNMSISNIRPILDKYEVDYVIATNYQEVSILYSNLVFDLVVIKWASSPTLVVKAIKTIISSTYLSIGETSRDFDYMLKLENEIYFKEKIMEIFTDLANRVTYTAKSCSDITDIKILIVEDEYINRIVLEKMLRKKGYTNISIAVNGMNALQLIDNDPSKYDIYLIDIRMPIISGFELADKIYTLSNDAKMIGVTAQTVIEKDKKPWFNVFVYKPIDFDELDKKIKRMVMG